MPLEKKIDPGIFWRIHLIADTAVHFRVIKFIKFIDELNNILGENYNMYMNQQDAQKILVIRLYFILDALCVSDYISPSSGATFISCTSYLVYAGTIRVAVVWL